MMTGVPVDKNAKQIVIKYQPPYWNTMIFISLMSMILSAIFVKILIQKRKMISKLIKKYGLNPYGRLVSFSS